MVPQGSAFPNQLTAQSGSQEGSLHSIDDGTTTAIQFVNQGSAVRQVFRLDFSGQRQLYLTMSPLTSAFQITFLTHPWLVADASGHCLSIFLPIAATGTAVFP